MLRLTGKPIDAHGGDFSNKAGAEIPYNPVMIGLTMPRAMLYDRINRRVDIMLEQGLVEEARAIYDRNYDRSLPALQGLGYKQLFRVFDGEYTLSEGIEAIKQETFLNSARKAKVPVTIHVTNGYQIKNAIITGYDSFVVTAEVGNEQMMIYKHAISTVTPNTRITINNQEQREE